MMNWNHFDERQLQKRGNAFKLGFFILLIENALLLFLFAILYDDPVRIGDLLPFTPATCLTLQIFLAVTVFATYCIWNDCYFSLNENRRYLLALFSACSILNLLMAIAHLIHGDFMEDGVFGTPFINLACGLMMLFICSMILLKRLRQKEDEE